MRTRFLNVTNNNLTNGVDVGQSNSAKTYYSDYQWQKKLEKYNLTATLGTTNEIVYARSDLFNGNTSRKNNSLYTQLDKKHRRLNISLGARYEIFNLSSEDKYLIDGESINNITSGKPVFITGLNYQLAEATYIRTSWGQGYRFPSMAELFIRTTQSGLEIYPNPNLKPESGWSSEIGIKQGLKLGNWMGYIDLAAFLMQYDDMMEFSFGRWAESRGDTNFYGLGFKSLNVGKKQISGIELSLNGQVKISKDFSVNFMGGYSYMHSISLTPDETYAKFDRPINLGGENMDSLTYNNNSSDPSALKYRYKHIAKIDIEIMYKELSLGGSFRYNDFMRNVDKIFTEKIIGGDNGMIPGINSARKKFKNGDLVIDLRAGYQITETARLGFIVNNLLNREYMSRPANMMPPRTIAMQLALKI